MLKLLKRSLSDPLSHVLPIRPAYGPSVCFHVRWEALSIQPTKPMRLGTPGNRKRPNARKSESRGEIDRSKGEMMRKIYWIPFLLVAVGMFAFSSASQAQVSVGVSVSFGPPELPVYEQPICPTDGYIWTPGYWAWDGYDYYWVPGTWVLAPETGFFWTPAWWGWGGRGYLFHPGYWGPRVGFYGGINYGYGYFGHGYEGGRWDRGHFYYNRSVNRIDERQIRNVYNTPVQYRNENRVSFNGGRGGIEARPSQQEEAAARERHMGPVAAQQQHINAARGDRSLRASENHGRPPVAATPRAGSFSGGGVEAARSGGNYNPPANRGGNAGGNARTERPPSARNDNGGNRPTYTHPNEVPKHDRP